MKTHSNQDSQSYLRNTGKFRTWCREKWFEHVEESRVWEGVEPTGTQQEYFARYKYWLKREYKHQRQTND